MPTDLAPKIDAGPCEGLPLPCLGIDIGAESVKAALVREGEVEDLGRLPVQGQPLARVREVLEKVRAAGVERAQLGLTGSGAAQVAALLEVAAVDESTAIVAACNLLHLDTRTVIEMGRETQRYLRLQWDETAGRLLLDDASLGGKCAAGSGSFFCERVEPWPKSSAFLSFHSA